MIYAPSPPATALEITGPQLAADRRGYLLANERNDGFADRPELDAASRRLIAGWARAFTPDLLESEQRRLLGLAAEPPKPLEEELRRAAIENAERDMPLAVDHGLYAQLTDDQIRAMREPWTVLKTARRREYPLSAGELAKLTGTTARQIRHWQDMQLLPVFWIDGRRYFFSAAAVHAFALGRLDRNEIRGASRVLFADPEDPVAAIVAVALARSDYTGAPLGLARWLTPKTKRPGERKMRSVPAPRRSFVTQGTLGELAGPSFSPELLLAGPGLPPAIVKYELASDDGHEEIVTVLTKSPDQMTAEQLYTMAGHHIGGPGTNAGKHSAIAVKAGNP